ncbi:hypothetical protein F2Q69_00019252 [Brassica cretica]|uniref:RIN4 pathogenic type III effector avirulence factor Avr cleavage site domain-containing protein n=1 Tax=Brassica cretica TaxID=69181 RepID=A0A8S9Q6G2_BRACR|nr:hypothetical protein F2Q69_00019252 [Brassica cretica]
MESYSNNVKDKSQIHDSRDTKKNSSLRENKVITTEGKGVADDKFEDILAFDESLDIEKDVKSNEKLTVERGCVKVDVNCTKAEQDSTQDQEKLRQEYERVLPKFDDWDVGGPVPDGYRHIFDIVRNERRGGALNEKCPTMRATPTRGTLNDEFYKNTDPKEKILGTWKMEKKATEHKRRGCVPTLRYLCFRKLGKEPRPEGFSTSPGKIDSFSLDTEKDEKSKKKQTVEQGSRKVDVNHTEAEQDSTQDQAKPRREQGLRVTHKIRWWQTASIRKKGFRAVFDLQSQGVCDSHKVFSEGFHGVLGLSLHGISVADGVLIYVAISARWYSFVSVKGVAEGLKGIDLCGYVFGATHSFLLEWICENEELLVQGRVRLNRWRCQIEIDSGWKHVCSRQGVHSDLVIQVLQELQVSIDISWKLWRRRISRFVVTITTTTASETEEETFTDDDLKARDGFRFFRDHKECRLSLRKMINRSCSCTGWLSCDNNMTKQRRNRVEHVVTTGCNPEDKRYETTVINTCSRSRKSLPQLVEACVSYTLEVSPRMSESEIPDE